MHPFSYTGLKIIHDQKIQEALEQQRLNTGQETHSQGLLQTFGKFLARFTNHSGRKQEGPFQAVLGECNAQFLVARALETPGEKIRCCR